MGNDETKTKEDQRMTSAPKAWSKGNEYAARTQDGVKEPQNESALTQLESRTPV
jgi:hypothetical protein